MIMQVKTQTCQKWGNSDRTSGWAPPSKVDDEDVAQSISMPQDDVGVCVSVCEGFKGGGLWMTERNWQAQTHRSGESMGPARAYLLPMMKPNTMKTRMMVPATATTAMMMTGFCSLETIAADNKEKHIFLDGYTSDYNILFEQQPHKGELQEEQLIACEMGTSPPPLHASLLGRVGEGASIYEAHIASLFQKVC